MPKQNKDFIYYVKTECVDCRDHNKLDKCESALDGPYKTRATARKALQKIEQKLDSPFEANIIMEEISDE